jgi:hypothetical protein
MFQKRHMEAIANLLKGTKPDVDSAIYPEDYRDGRKTQWAVIVMQFANLFTLANPRFDHKRWRKACGLPE